MPSIFEKLCEKFLNIYIYLAGFFGYEIGANNIQASSFVIDENNIDIEIIDSTKDTDQTNLTKYLKHHIMFTDDKFHPMYFFDEPLVVRFKYQNETYRICLKQLEAKNTDHSISINEPKYLSAIVKHHDDDEGIHVTDILVEFHGPDRNFFSHIPDTVSEIPMLLSDHKGHKLHTFDMMGNQKIHHL
jgi:hypothetical protein